MNIRKFYSVSYGRELNLYKVHIIIQILMQAIAAIKSRLTIVPFIIESRNRRFLFRLK